MALELVKEFGSLLVWGLVKEFGLELVWQMQLVLLSHLVLPMHLA